MSEREYSPQDRRPLKSRGVRFFQVMAFRLSCCGVSPNMISIASVVFALFAGVFIAGVQFGIEEKLVRVGLVLGACFIQLRLLANMLDGMVAIESGKGTATGELYNEVPDRLADPVILMGAGYAAGSDVTLGFIAALMALFVAYLRALGCSVGAGQAFHGPMAKPHRMFTLTIACAYCGLAPGGLEVVGGANGWGVMSLALGLIVVGCVVTSVRRLIFIANALKEGAV